MVAPKGFRCVAQGRGALEVRLALAALEGAGIPALAPALTATATWGTGTLRGASIAIFVPDARADEAIALLQAIDAGQVISHAPAEAEVDAKASPRRGWPRGFWIGRRRR